MEKYRPSRFQEVKRINLLSNGNDRRFYGNIFGPYWKKQEPQPSLKSELNNTTPEGFLFLRELTEELFPCFDGKDFDAWIDTMAENGRGSILQYGKPAEWKIAKDITDKFGTGIKNYTRYVLTSEEKGQETHSWQANYHRKEGTSNDFDPDKIGRNSFDIVFAQNISARTEKQFDLIKKLYDVTAQDGLLFVHGIVLEKQVAVDLVSKWQELGYQFAFNADSPHDFRNGGLTILSIAMRKNTDSLFAPKSLGKLIRIRIGTFLVD